MHTLLPEEVPGKLWNLPVEHLLFAGKSTCKRLKSLGIYTIGDLAQADSGMPFARKAWACAAGVGQKGSESAGMFDMDAENKAMRKQKRHDAGGWDRPCLCASGFCSLCETVGIRACAEHKKAGGVSVGNAHGRI